MAHLRRNQLINRLSDAHLVKLGRRYARGRLVDVGCGEKQYEALFKPFVTEHIGVDHPDTLHGKSKVDITATGYEIPVNDCEFDTVLHTSVLEHMEDPERALRECARVLKPGGNIIFLIPFIWHVHEAPRDFYRYTPLGIRYLLEKTGFSVRELSPVCGFWGTFGQMLTYKLYKYPILRNVPSLTDRLGLLVQLSAYLVDKIDFDDDWPAVYAGAAERVAATL
ncbi:MAG TPA: class I SAM-dependent methyltransferase [Polyangia bacterium]|nr:class I SAM-dependent methyltransferase [Polyangia bacterium]